jgi:hypothetical protein
MYEYEVKARSSATASDVWDLLADANAWPAWTGLPMPTRDRDGDPPPWGMGSIRRFSWGPVYVREQVAIWEPPHRYGYTLANDWPLRDYLSTVTLTEAHGGTDISWRGSFERSMFPGTSSAFTWFVKTMLQKYAHRLARLAEEQHASRGQSSG